MPLINDIFGGESMGRKKHGGPLVPHDPVIRSDGLHRDSQFSAWGGDGNPFVRSHFRAADDSHGEPDLFKRRDPIKRVYEYIEDYKKEMIEQGREDDVAPSAEALAFTIEDTLPEEAVEDLREAFARKDPEALAQVMISLDKYDPKHKGLDERIQFFLDELNKAFAPEFTKDKKLAQNFLIETLTPHMPEKFKEIERDRKAVEKYEEAKEKALARRREQLKVSESSSGFPASLDLTDSALSVIQNKSASLEWEQNALMGAHPGIMFGAHCAATLEQDPLSACWGSEVHAPRNSVDFAQRYPKSNGRVSLEGLDY
jgi:hypothetical protein